MVQRLPVLPAFTAGIHVCVFTIVPLSEYNVQSLDITDEHVVIHPLRAYFQSVMSILRVTSPRGQ